MANFDSMHFENAQGHALASLTSAEKYLEDGDLEGARIAFNCARPYIKIMENEADNEGAPRSKDGEWKELQNRLASLCDKYHEMKEATENWVDDTTENEEVEEEKNVDVLKLNEVVATTIETIREFNKDFSVDDVEEMDRAIVLIQGLKEAVDSDLASILEKLEDARKDAEIIAKVEAIRKSFQCCDERATMNNTVEELRNFVKLRNGEGSSMTLSAAAVFAAIHQTCDDLKIDYELFDDKSAFDANRWGLNGSYCFFYRVDYGGSEGIYLDMWLERNGVKTDLATIKTLREDEDAFRKMSALGCEYAIAFRNITKNI